jgi:DNA-directed RNA polymerase specialized sigma24 family protein
MPTTIAPRFNQLVEQHYQPLFRFAASLCGRPETALELTQRTFHRALEGNSSLPARSNVKQWLFTILFLEFLEIRPRAGKSAGQVDFS